MSDIPKDETILLRRRKHWFVLYRELAPSAFLAFAPFILYPFIAGYEFTIGTYSIEIYVTAAWATFLGSAWLLIFWMKGIGIWTDYYLDIWSITDKKIIDNEQKGFFHRETSVLRLEKIQDVTIETRGFVATFLNFGDIHVQTAGEEREFVMYGIASPKHVRDIIVEAQDLVLETSKLEV